MNWHECAQYIVGGVLVGRFLVALYVVLHGRESVAPAKRPFESVVCTLVVWTLFGFIYYSAGLFQ
jgi:hypothetical protein